MSKLKKLYWSQAGMETRTNTPQGVMHFYHGLEADAEIARLREVNAKQREFYRRALEKIIGENHYETAQEIARTTLEGE